MNLDTFAEIVGRISYKPDWHFETAGPTLQIRLSPCRESGTYAGYLLSDTFHVTHALVIPPDLETEDDAVDWIMRQIVKVETHEACEFFQVDGGRPFYPHRGGETSYVVRRLAGE